MIFRRAPPVQGPGTHSGPTSGSGKQQLRPPQGALRGDGNYPLWGVGRQSLSGASKSVRNLFSNYYRPPCASPAPIGGGGALRCLRITCNGNFDTFVQRLYLVIAMGDCPSGGCQAPRSVINFQMISTEQIDKRFFRGSIFDRDHDRDCNLKPGSFSIRICFVNPKIYHLSEYPEGIDSSPGRWFGDPANKKIL
jgi:hypothetical protein